MTDEMEAGERDLWRELVRLQGKVIDPEKVATFDDELRADRLKLALDPPESAIYCTCGIINWPDIATCACGRLLRDDDRVVGELDRTSGVMGRVPS